MAGATPSPQMGRLLMAPPAPRSASSAASPGLDLLGEAQSLMQPYVPAAPPPRRQVSAPPATAAAPSGADNRTTGDAPKGGQAVQLLPMDWALKRGILVSSASSLDWATSPLPSIRCAALSHGNAGRRIPQHSQGTDSRSAVAFALEHSLVQWRHPGHRQPAFMLKQLTSPAVGSSAETREYVDGLNDAWDAALRSLFSALRDGRLPYFYCRAEPPPKREASAASASGLTILWRNTALAEEEHADTERPQLPLGWATTDDASCYAVLTPSSRGLRAALEAHGVPFEMPLAPPGMRGGVAASGTAVASPIDPLAGGDDSAAANNGRQAARGRADLSLGDDDSTLASLNRGLHDDVQPDSELGQQHTLSTLDYKTGSTLVVKGREALHALHEFLINARPSPQAPHPYFLVLHLLSPQPFVNGVPHTPRVLLQSGRRAGPEVAEEPDGGPSPAAGGGATEDSMRLEDAERGGGALLLPSTIRRLVAILLQMQPLGFELRVQPDEGGASSEAVNVQPSRPAVSPLDLLSCAPPRRAQPEAELRIHSGDGVAQPVEAPTVASACDPAHQEARALLRPRCISHLHFTRDGQLRLL